MSDEYEYGPWVGWNNGQNPPPSSETVQVIMFGGLGQLRWGNMKSHDVAWSRGNIIAYRIATPKPKREFVVGKWYRPLVSGRWQRCIAIEGEMAWLVQPSNHPFAHPWEEGEINWAVSPRDEAPE